LAAIHRVKGVKEETVMEWLRIAAAHVERIFALLLAYYHLRSAQLDAMWAYVGNKGEKGAMLCRRERHQVRGITKELLMTVVPPHAINR
jgi:hypothetical protein